MDSQQNPYHVLGLAFTATPEQVTHAYRIMVRRHHPDSPEYEPDDDAASGSGSRLQQVYAAYTTLGDAGRRAEYDRHHREDALRGRTIGTRSGGLARTAAGARPTPSVMQLPPVVLDVSSHPALVPSPWVTPVGLYASPRDVTGSPVASLLLSWFGELW